MAIDDLYEQDHYAWAQAQAEALRAAGRAGGRSNTVEWERVAEEIEDMARRDLREARSLVVLIIEHLLKLAWTARDAPKVGWRAEIAVFRDTLEDTLTATIRRDIDADLERLHGRALRRAAIAFTAHEPDVARDESLRWSLPQILGEADDPLEAG